MGLGHFSAGVRVVDCVMLTIDAVAATAVGGYAGKVGCTAAGAVFTGVGTVAAVAIVMISLGLGSEFSSNAHALYLSLSPNNQ